VLFISSSECRHVCTLPQLMSFFTFSNNACGQKRSDFCVTWLAIRLGDRDLVLEEKTGAAKENNRDVQRIGLLVVVKCDVVL